MTKMNLGRSSHAGKSPDEVEIYKKFLKEKRGLEKTVEDAQKLYKTDSSSFEDEEIKPAKIQKTSKFLKLKDWFMDNLVTAVLAGLFIAAVGWAWNITFDIKMQTFEIKTVNTNITNMKDNIKTLETNNSNEQTNFNNLKQSFEVFKTEIKKDIEFIKKKIKF